MSPEFAPTGADARPLHVVGPEGLEAVLSDLPPAARAWVGGQDFKAGAGAVLLYPGEDGAPVGALVGLGPEDRRARHRFSAAAAASRLPEGAWALAGDHGPEALSEAALGWLFAAYRFDRYKTSGPQRARLVAPEGVDADRLLRIAEGEWLTRDLINTPASDMGPAELEAAARDLAEEHGATLSVTTGDDLLAAGFPLIHAVGRAAAPHRAPRLIELRWGTGARRLTLVGKGVCFDTGGLNLKPGASMGLMKKDMGGAATVLGLAHMIMGLGLDLSLRVLVPAVENSVGSDSFRPQDVLTSRKGLTVEINNTDAEGRLVLADALALADADGADRIVSMATLTGAARVAVGPDLAPYYADDAFAAALEPAARRVADPVWRMPFHDPYEAMIEPGIADLDNAPKGGFAGSVTAALFLRRFVTETPYAHFDIYGWNPADAPGRPKGGVGMGARALFAALPDLLAS